jgi:hypothetical protein
MIGNGCGIWQHYSLARAQRVACFSFSMSAGINLGRSIISTSDSVCW